jgi:uncharacterized protein YfaQ (DUF2300 family)
MKRSGIQDRRRIPLRFIGLRHYGTVSVFSVSSAVRSTMFKLRQIVTFRHASACAVLAAAALAGGTAAAQEPVLAWLRDGQVQMRTLGPVQASAATLTPPQAPGTVPLGSLWKLWVYVYLSEQSQSEPPHICAATPATGDHYCCDPGASVERDAALAKSCAPYFAPKRLGIGNTAWRTYWMARGAAPWLRNLEQMRPDTQVAVAELLGALSAVSPQARAQARRALLDTSLSGNGRDAWTVLGTGVRYKTYTWHRAEQPDIAFGGAAGWLPDGTPFWFGARGASRHALATWAPQIAAALPAPRWREANTTSDAACVEVDFFARYPLRAAWHGDSQRRATPGALHGRYRLEFANGNWLTITAAGELQLEGDDEPRIRGRFAVNDYIARVIDREGSATPIEAARALGVAARSYLLQNARFEAGCYVIEDASRTQRVSAHLPSNGALAAAWFTDDLILRGAPVQYHRDTPAPNRLAWNEAVAQAAQGWSFERILAAAYPQASLASLSGHEDCARLAAAETWLKRAAQTWQRQLQREAGFEPLDGPIVVCALNAGAPYSDQLRARIYVRGWRSLDERITLAHEYLHLVFRLHPNGADEAFVERLARQLVAG